MIENLVQPLVISLIGSERKLFSVGQLLETSDGDLLYTADDALMLLGGVQAQSTNRPEILLYTTDNDTLFTSNNHTLTV